MSPAAGDPAERVRDLLEEIADALDLDAAVEVEVRDGVVHGTLVGEELGLFIGRHGQTIDAVQHLAFKAATRGEDRSEGFTRVVIDAAGYRDRRAQVLHRQADQAASEALRSGRPAPLESMSATERKVVHEYLSERTDLETYSEGSEPDRHLVVAPLQP